MQTAKRPERINSVPNFYGKPPVTVVNFRMVQPVTTGKLTFAHLKIHLLLKIKTTRVLANSLSTTSTGV